MSPNAVGTLAWVFLFGGILVASFGWFAQAANPVTGGLFLTGGGLAVAAGIALIVVRSRMKDGP